MKRRHLFEFEDFTWFPDVIRRGATDYLRFIIEKLDFYKDSVPIIKRLMDKTGEREILDLCSGGGGGMVKIREELEKLTDTKIRVTLSDKFPNLSAFEDIEKVTDGAITYVKEPVDAAEVPAGLKGIRTMYSAFHHFEPDYAREILRNSVSSNAPIAIFDGAGNRFLGALGILLVHPIIFFICTPFIKPFAWSRLLFTYIIPLIPICTVWDGIASAFRFYNTEELKELIEDESLKSYTWETGVKKGLLSMGMRYLTGYPRLSGS